MEGGALAVLETRGSIISVVLSTAVLASAVGFSTIAIYEVIRTRGDIGLWVFVPIIYVLILVWVVAVELETIREDHGTTMRFLTQLLEPEA